MSAGSTPARSHRLPAGLHRQGGRGAEPAPRDVRAAASATKGPEAARRVWIPLRSTIHSSARLEEGGDIGVGHDPLGKRRPPAGDGSPGHDACSQAIGWPVCTRSPGWARAPSKRPANGERTSMPDTVPSRVPTSMGRAGVQLEVLGRLEDARPRADHHPLGHVEVFALVAQCVGMEGSVARYGVDQAVEVPGCGHGQGRDVRQGLAHQR